MNKITFRQASKPLSITKNSNIGILLIHGYPSTPSSLYYLADKFSKVNFNIELPLLSGFGTRWQDLNKVSYQDWISDIEKALIKLKKRVKKVFVSGLSMGGLLTLYLAEQHPELKGIIILNPALILNDWRLPLLPMLRFVLKATKTIGADLKDPDADEITYDYTPTNGVYEMTKLQKIVKKYLNVINQPTLIFKSRTDHVVPTINAPYIYNHISSTDKNLIWLENSYHVVPLDYDKDLVCQKTIEFIKKH